MTRQQQAILDALADGREHSIWELIQSTGVTRPAARVFELRPMGYNIVNRKEKVDGVMHSYWRLVTAPKQLSLMNDLPRLREGG